MATTQLPTFRWPRRAELAGALIGLASLVSGGAGAATFSAAAVDAIESCVDASSPIRFAAGERRASLARSDAAEVAAALLARYPAVAQTGVTPDGIVLWARPGDGWVYIALIVNPERADEVCFVATFSAARFEFTAALSRKYFGVNV